MIKLFIGKKGKQGEQGPVGAQGIRGVEGVQGQQGVAGVKGVKGIQGLQGFIGNGHRDMVIQKMVTLILIVLLGILSVVVFWLTYPYKPIVFNNLPFKVENKVVKQGTPLIYVADYCKYSEKIPTVTRHFVNGIVYLVSLDSAVSKPKGCGIFKVQILVPDTLPPDNYKLKITYKYQINPIRTVDVVVETEPFTVIR